MDDDFGFTLRGRKSDRKGNERGEGEQGEQGEQEEDRGNRTEETQNVSSFNQHHKSENLLVVKEGENDMKEVLQDQQEKTVSTPTTIAMDERNQGSPNPNPLAVSDTKQSIVMQNYLDSLSRVVENTTYWDDDGEFSDMEEAMMMPNPEYEPYIQMEPIPGKDDEIPFQQGEIRQLADDYY